MGVGGEKDTLSLASIFWFYDIDLVFVMSFEHALAIVGQYPGFWVEIIILVWGFVTLGK